MQLRFEVSLSIGRLRTGDAANGRRTLYASIAIGSWHAYVSRWDTARVQSSRKYPAQFPKRRVQFDLYRGPVMTWYAGAWATDRVTA